MRIFGGKHRRGGERWEISIHWANCPGLFTFKYMRWRGDVLNSDGDVWLVQGFGAYVRLGVRR